MVRIVAGEREDPNIALLQGMQLGQGFRQAREARQRAQSEQMNQVLRMQEIQMRFQKARAEQEEALAKAAQMGDVRAQQIAVMRSRLKESDKMSEDLLKVASKTTDPKAFSDLMSAGDDLIKQQRSAEEIQAAQKSIDDAVENGLIDDVTATNSRNAIASGKSPGEVVAPLIDLSRKRAEAHANKQSAAKFIEQARARLETMTPSARRDAEVKLAEYELSPSKQAEADSGAALLGDIEAIANKGRDQQIASYVKQRTSEDFADRLAQTLQASEGQFGEKEFPSNFFAIGDKVLGGGPVDQPRTPAMQAHIDKQRAEKERRYPGSTKPATAESAAPPASKKHVPLPRAAIRKAKTEDDVIDALIADGKELTPENISAALSHWRAGGR